MHPFSAVTAALEVVVFVFAVLFLAGEAYDAVAFTRLRLRISRMIDRLGLAPPPLPPLVPLPWGPRLRPEPLPLPPPPLSLRSWWLEGLFNFLQLEPHSAGWTYIRQVHPLSYALLFFCVLCIAHCITWARGGVLYRNPDLAAGAIFGFMYLMYFVVRGGGGRRGGGGGGHAMALFYSPQGAF